MFSNAKNTNHLGIDVLDNVHVCHATSQVASREDERAHGSGALTRDQTIGTQARPAHLELEQLAKRVRGDHVSCSRNGAGAHSRDKLHGVSREEPLCRLGNVASHTTGCN